MDNFPERDSEFPGPGVFKRSSGLECFACYNEIIKKMKGRGSLCCSAPHEREIHQVVYRTSFRLQLGTDRASCGPRCLVNSFLAPAIYCSNTEGDPKINCADLFGELFVARRKKAN